MSVVIDPRGGGLHRPRDIDRGEGALVQEKAMESSGVEADDRPAVIGPDGDGAGSRSINRTEGGCKCPER